MCLYSSGLDSQHIARRAEPAEAPRTSSCVRRVQIGSSVADILGRNLFHLSASSDVRGMGSGDYMPAPHVLVVWCNCVVLFVIPEGSLIGLCCVMILRIWRAIQADNERDNQVKTREDQAYYCMMRAPKHDYC